MKKNSGILISFLAIVFFGLMLSTPVLAETQSFSDNFENADKWILRDGWSIAKDGGNSVLKGEKHSFATAVSAGSVQSLGLKIKILRGGVHLNVRAREKPDGMERYFIGLGGGHSSVKKQAGNDRFEDLANGEKGISLNQWHEIKIVLQNGNITVLADGEVLVSAFDKNFLSEGGVSFETFEDSTAYFDGVEAEFWLPDARSLDAKTLFQNGVHEGDLTLAGREALVLEDGRFEQFGNIYLKDDSKLVVKNAVLQITKYQRLLNHWGIWLEDTASLEVNNSKLLPGEGALFVIEGGGASRITLQNSPTKVHLFTASGGAKAVVENSEIVSDIGGLVSAYDNGFIRVNNSKIGAVNLFVPPNATLVAEGLRTGFFKKWSLQEDLQASGIDSNIILENTELVPDEIGPGPFERGWPIFIDSSAKVKIKNSVVRKIVLELGDERAEFSDFYLEKPSNFKYRDIELENVTVKGQWGVFLHGSSDVVVRDSDAFWTFIYDDSKLRLINTHMNEFDPRNFHGEIAFENATWDTAAEIIENNDFTMLGSIGIGEIGGFSWENSSVTRIYDLIGKPDSELALRKGGETVWRGKTDSNGEASFSLKFGDATFDDSWLVQDNFGNENEVTFFSKTPIYIEQDAISKVVQKIKSNVHIPTPPPELGDKAIFLPALAVFALIVLFLFLRKKYLKREK